VRAVRTLQRQMRFREAMGRPREFEENVVLEKVLHAFWRCGYEGTSLDDLTEATGLGKSSFYKAFGSKAELYRRANDRYRSSYLGFQGVALSKNTPRRIAEALLLGEAELQTSPYTPPGCFETNGALACSEENEEVRHELLRSRNHLRQRCRDRFEATRDAGPLIGNSSEEAAEFVMTLIQGMAVQAKGGVSRRELKRFVKLAMQAWPTGKSPVSKRL
jgi:AcrR family transcriptional regulator